ncbi:hypothetical protein L1I79_11870 [Strepomyces sp. STD 3.1]|nr:hypothetical protein [Streptomyces sp. STD 3.1]
MLGDDVRGFCAAPAGGEAARTYRDRLCEQLNRNVARSRAGGARPVRFCQLRSAKDSTARVLPVTTMTSPFSTMVSAVA